MRAARGAVLGSVCLMLVSTASLCGAKPRPALSDAPPSAVGAAIYLHGVLGSGEPLAATRQDAEPLKGAQAACVNCHRRSGLGSKEARNVIPPVTGAFLFEAHSDQSHNTDLPFIPGARPDRSPYSEATLARAIREGIDSEGHPLSYLMPRFALTDSDMAALIGHLRSLDHRRAPGVSQTELHFATILTPDVQPEKRRAVRQVLEQFFADRNLAPRGPASQTMTTSGATAFAKTMFKVNRRWVLHVWEPTGPASTWREQLEKSFREQPVFAVVSGISGLHWNVVNDFCQQRAVPCLFPNVELPPADADGQFHAVYFSRGVLLEADLIAAGIADPRLGDVPAHVLQIYRTGDVGSTAAQALAMTLKERGIKVSDLALTDGVSVATALRDTPRADAVVLWLRPADLAALPASGPRKTVYLSGLMGGLDAAPLPQAWREQVHMAYPVDLPERRRVRLDYALGWFRIRRIPVVDEQLQADTYLACGLLSETVKHLVDAFVPDYLIERLEDTVEHRILTGYYPRLTLAPNQRFASKGGFLVHFDATRGAGHLVADGDWITP